MTYGISKKFKQELIKDMRYEQTNSAGQVFWDSYLHPECTLVCDLFEGLEDYIQPHST